VVDINYFTYPGKKIGFGLGTQLEATQSQEIILAKVCTAGNVEVIQTLPVSKK
jgi:hypothetical protein